MIARALNGGELARAAIAAVLTRTPELTREAAARLAEAEEELTKYDPSEPRDWHGRWTTGGSAAGQGAAPKAPQVARPELGAAERNAPLAPVVSPTSDGGAEQDELREPASLEQALERKYDDLGPVDFAKQVIQFGDALGREGKTLSPAEKERALAEYSFLEDRLSFWLAYEYTPPAAQGNLHSAALMLFQGANNAGIVAPGHLPKSMLDVAAEVWAIDNLPPRVRLSTKPTVELEPEAPAEAPKEVEGLGGIVDNSEVGIDWNAGTKDQGDPLEAYVGRQNPDAEQLPVTSKTFDQFMRTEGEAISDKTLNTLTVGYIKNPQRIYWRVKGYTDATADYTPRTDSDLDPEYILSKTIQLAIPEYTSPTQWRYLFAAIFYAKERGVRLVITRIRE